VLEAMASGAPVLCSDASSIPEVAGAAALTFDPTDAGAIGAALRRALGDPTLRAALRARGFVQAAHFSWKRAAAETLTVYRRLPPEL
jgi:alpha-1,3-rhamnosyl/mannosyltransferase